MMSTTTRSSGMKTSYSVTDTIIVKGILVVYCIRLIYPSSAASAILSLSEGRQAIEIM